MVESEYQCMNEVIVHDCSGASAAGCAMWSATTVIRHVTLVALDLRQLLMQIARDLSSPNSLVSHSLNRGSFTDFLVPTQNPMARMKL
ncbi:hypothetical protein MPTK1_6g13430 [Marchantia polymorpha subsp. ruderalis]|uniref:Uncharacterized protein n=2 Tax=Marchantia polymorpha TaxID=3197 RepID=A0AAF6BRN0_MARPO|nr:hypothetical protein MARPO_0059s0007 [Marchantia polymorpha]BBN14664.1 hypothetical protein Mp_6g13430 [Marchantia polymorpha subsp. ruderalis]|eukprot:PTQ37055.1 hypothetical protein MARPO_0059s0007 [Marchantia polymorpha]